MGESEGTSRRNVLAILVVFVVGAARFGEDIVRAAVKARHPLRAFARSDDESNPESPPQQDANLTNPTVDNDLSGTESVSEFVLWTVEKEITVEESRYYYWDFDLEEGSSIEDEPILEYDILVRDGPRIDVFVLEEDEFEAFEQNENFRYHSVSETETLRANGRGQLDRETYYIVIKNPAQSLDSSDSSTESESKVSVEVSFENRS